MPTMRVTAESDDVLEVLVKALVVKLAVYGEIHITIEEFEKAAGTAVDVTATVGGTLDLKVV